MPGVTERRYSPYGFFIYKYMLLTLGTTLAAGSYRTYAVEDLRSEKPKYRNIKLLKH